MRPHHFPGYWIASIWKAIRVPYLLENFQDLSVRNNTSIMTNMTIKYANGTVLHAVLLSRDADILCAGVLGEDDARIFTLVSGKWTSEDCEVVRIEFGWERPSQLHVPTEAECVCSEQFASRLVSMLLAGSQGDHVLEDMLWVFAAEGQRVRLDHGQRDIDEAAGEFLPVSLPSALLN